MTFSAPTLFVIHTNRRFSDRLAEIEALQIPDYDKKILRRVTIYSFWCLTLSPMFAVWGSIGFFLAFPHLSFGLKVFSLSVIALMFVFLGTVVWRRHRKLVGTKEGKGIPGKGS